MSSASSTPESEILLGNKQLLAVFAVVALLLAIAFTGGYMLGKNSGEKKATTATLESGAESSSGVLTKTVSPDDAASKTDAASSASNAQQEAPAIEPLPIAKAKPVVHETVLGAPKNVVGQPEVNPPAGQTFVQIAALTRIQASAMADVLRKKGFHSRIAPKPGSTAIYRVLVGPVKDAGDLASTRDSLRKIGFREVWVQRY